MLLILITGASGSGKTTLVKTLEQKLKQNKVSINYFDNIGIPSLEDMVAIHGSVEKWQEWATHSWIEKIAKMADKEIFILEGSFNPEFAINAMKKFLIKDYLLLCLHANRQVREERLIFQRNQKELATQEMENFAQVLLRKTLHLGGTVVDSSNKNISALAQEIIEIITKHVPIKV
jgi:dephospho-CoA kinase